MKCICRHEEETHGFKKNSYCGESKCKCEKFEADTDFSVTEAHKPHKLEDGKFNSSKSDNSLDASVCKSKVVGSQDPLGHPEIHSQPIDPYLEGSKIGSSPDTFQSLIAGLDLSREDTYQDGFIEGVQKAEKMVEDAIEKVAYEQQDEPENNYEKGFNVGVEVMRIRLKEELGI